MQTFWEASSSDPGAGTGRGDEVRVTSQREASSSGRGESSESLVKPFRCVMERECAVLSMVRRTPSLARPEVVIGIADGAMIPISSAE